MSEKYKVTTDSTLYSVFFLRMVKDWERNISDVVVTSEVKRKYKMSCPVKGIRIVLIGQVAGWLSILFYFILLDLPIIGRVTAAA